MIQTFLVSHKKIVSTNFVLQKIASKKITYIYFYIKL